MRTEVPQPPPWLADLPRDPRGFLVPAEAAWFEGAPHLSKVPIPVKVALAITRSCAICGYFLAPGEAVYRAFSQGDAAKIRMYEREFSHDMHGPAHKSCMLYSTFVCPYLREPGARLKKDSLINPGAPRGTRPAVFGFADFALLIFDGRHDPLDPSTPETMPYFGYRQVLEDIPYRSPFELLEELAAALMHDSATIDRSQPRQYWTDAPEDNARLLAVLEKGLPLLAGDRPLGPAKVFGRPYAVLGLPPAGW